MKKQFNKVKKLARELFEQRAILDAMVIEKYGFHYSETDDDSIIDTLVYGISSISFENFDQRMKSYKEDFDSNKPFKIIP